MQSIVTPIIATSTLISHGVLVLVIFFYSTSKEVRGVIESSVCTYINEYIFSISLVAMVGSLIYSNLIGFPPCELCWWARIFMYPQTIIASIAYIKKDKSIVDYSIALSILGFLLTLYHSFVLLGGKSILPCTQEGSACSKLYVFEYGYITIPVMAFTIFAYLLFVGFVYKRSTKKN